MSRRICWNDRVTQWLIRLVFLGVSIPIGMYMLVPNQVRAGDADLPPTHAALPNGVVQIVNSEGVVPSLPVMVA